MKNWITALALFLCHFAAYGQEDSIKPWKTGGFGQIMFSQAAYSNWAAGGENTIAFTFGAKVFANYSKGVSSWNNDINVAYGKVKVGDETRKSDDEIIFNTLYSRKLNEKTGLAANGNFRTQLGRGYRSPGDSVIVSKFMSPSFGLFSLGIDYTPAEYFIVFISPVTLKWTHVGDIQTVNPENYGLEAGTKNRYELGGYLRMKLDKKLMTNVNLSSTLELFSNYLDRPQNVDVNWLNKLNMKVNKYITAAVTVQMIYDYDVLLSKVDEQGNVKEFRGIQWREILNIGMSYNF